MSQTNSISKVAFITGAAGGIGQSIADNFVKKNYRVALLDQHQDALQKQAKNLAQTYNLTKENQPLIFALDISNQAQVKHAVEQVMQQYGRIDVLFNGAGIARVGGSEMSYQDFDEIIKINLYGTFNCLHEIIPIMKKQKSGYIFNVASRQGKMASANLAGYASSKYGVIGLNESVFKELINAGIKVTALCPSYTATPMMDIMDFPREEMLEPEDLTKTVNYLMSLSAPACVKEVLIEIRKLIT